MNNPFAEANNDSNESSEVVRVNNPNISVFLVSIEDSPVVQEFYRRELPGVMVVPALTLGVAHMILSQASIGERRIDFVVFDACLENRRPDTLGLVKEFRKKIPTALFIGASSSPAYNDLLVQAGCSYATHKDGLPQMIKGFLGNA